MTPETDLLSAIMSETLRAETPDPDAAHAPDPAQAALDRDASAFSLALDATLAQGAPAPLGLDAGVIPSDPTPAPAGEQAPVDYLLGATVPVQAPQGPDPASLQAKLAEITARLQAKQGTTAPVQSRAERMHAVGAQAEFTRLPAYKGRPATWALLVHPIDGMTPERGQVVTVAKRNGALEAHEIGAVLFQKGQGWVCALVSPQAKAVPLCPGNNNCRRYGHRKGRNCR